MPPKADAKAKQAATGENDQARMEREVIEKELVINALRQKLDRSASSVLRRGPVVKWTTKARKSPCRILQLATCVMPPIKT